MSELHRFLFQGMPVRGLLVRLTDDWTEMLARRASNTDTGAYPQPVRALLGEMAAAATLMQANIAFDGALVLQLHGDGPVRLAVAEVESDLRLRATATLAAPVPDGASLAAMANAAGRGRCAITLDPKRRSPGRQPYQGIVPLHGDHGEPLQRLSEVLEHYMLQSEQLDTKLVLAADDRIAAGLLIQRMPAQGERNLARGGDEDGIGLSEDFGRIALLAGSLRADELLTLDADTILRRLFWEEPLSRLAPAPGASAPRFACSCSREKVAAMLTSLGREEADSIVAEQGSIQVGCEFCGLQYRFDAVDAAGLFQSVADRPPGSTRAQ